MRSMILALLVLALAAPAAQASVADGWLPIKEASDGIAAVTAKRGHAIRFAPAADRLYRSIGGRRARVTCLHVYPRGGEFEAEIATEGNLGVLPRKRGTVRLDMGISVDVCAIQTRRVMRDDCISMGRVENLCPRVIVAFNDEGRAYLDHTARTFEIAKVSDLAVSLPRDFDPTLLGLLQGAVGPDVMLLDSPDATPPTGKVGYWEHGTNRATVALLADGRRRFLRYDGDVISTNLARLTTLDVSLP